jgi:hypothetical protein
MLCRSSARLCLDLVDEEPLAVVDLARSGCTMADLHLITREKSAVPCFFSGPAEKRPRHLTDIARSRFNAYPN